MSNEYNKAKADALLGVADAGTHVEKFVASVSDASESVRRFRDSVGRGAPIELPPPTSVKPLDANTLRHMIDDEQEWVFHGSVPNEKDYIDWDKTAAKILAELVAGGYVVAAPTFDFDKALAHLSECEKNYAEIGSAGHFALTHVIRPLRDRAISGERTQALYDEIMEVSL